MLFEDYLLIIQQNKYVYSLVILLLFYILSQLVIIISRKVILTLTKKTKTDVDDLIVKRTNKPLSLILILIGLRLAIFPLGLNNNILDIVENVMSSVMVFIVTYIAVAIIEIFIDNWARKLAEKTHSPVDEEVIPLFKKLSKIFVLIIGLLFVLPLWGIQVGPLLASLGVVGIAVAFALQNTLSNIFGGASILLDKSVRVGDKIKLDNDTMGTVLEVGLRSTKIRTFDNELVTIPNGKLADSKILNYIHPDPSVRIAVDFGVEYGSDTSKVRKIVLETLRKIPDVLKYPAPKVIMMEMGDFALKFRALFWVYTFDIKSDTQSRATEEIYNALTKSRIGIPFPTRTVYLKKGK